MKSNSEALYETWNKRWESSDREEKLTFIGRMMFKAKEKALTTVIKNLPVTKVIEVGCGLGHTMEVFKKNGLPCEGIDISQYAVSVCRKKGLNVTQRKLEDITDKYDLVSSDGMLEHFLNFEPYAQRMMNISKNYVLLIQPNHDSFWGKTLAYLAELMCGRVNVFEYNYRITDFVTVFEQNGFKITGNHPIFFNVFRLLLFKKI